MNNVIIITEMIYYKSQMNAHARVLLHYLVQGDERNREYIQMKAAATEIIHQGIGVYTVPLIRPATTTPWATTAGGACVPAYQQTCLCRLPRPDDQNTIILADASGTMGLTPAAGGAGLQLQPDKTGQLRQHHLTWTTIFGASWHGELNVGGGSRYAFVPGCLQIWYR